MLVYCFHKLARCFHLTSWLPANALVRSPTKTRRKYEGEMKKINLFFIKSKGVFDLIGFFVRLLYSLLLKLLHQRQRQSLRFLHKLDQYAQPLERFL